MTNHKQQQHPRPWTTGKVVLTVLTHLIVAVLAFQIGLLRSFHRRIHDDTDPCIDRSQNVESRSIDSHRPPPASSTIPSSLTKLVMGVATVNIHSFLKNFAFGFPLFGRFNPKYTQFTPGFSNVLLLYLHPSSLPNAKTPWSKAKMNNETTTTTTLVPPQDRQPQPQLRGPPLPLEQYASAKIATQNCRTVQHILTHLNTARDRQLHACIALVGQPTHSYRLSKWKRSDANGSTLKPVSRYQFREQWNLFNGLLIRPPGIQQSRTALKVLADYLYHMGPALEKLRPIAAKVAQAGNPKVKNNLIVLVSNYGHSDLFINFVCAAQAAGLDLNKLLLFATDDETYQLATQLGIAAFHDEHVFASIPRHASESYGDNDYAKIMMSKVYCVHLISQLGYHFLFQDVDIMIYKSNYLEWFIDQAAKEPYDLFFQHDFNERAEYAPWYVSDVPLSLFLSLSCRLRPRRSGCCCRRPPPTSPLIIPTISCFFLNKTFVKDFQFGLLLRGQQCTDKTFVCGTHLLR